MTFQLHPLNTDFVWEPHQGPLRRLTPEQVRAYDELGFFALENVFDGDTIAAIVSEIDPFEAQTEARLRALKDGRAFIARAGEITFTTHLVKRSPRLRQFCTSAVFQDLAHDLIGLDARLYWDQAIYKKPHTLAPFPWHQDNGYTFVMPQQYLTCWVALTDADERNGCIWVLPGAHRHGTIAHEISDLGYVCLPSTPQEAVPVPIGAGGIVVFSSVTPHTTGPNHTSQTRKAYNLQFVPDGAYAIVGDSAGKWVPRAANAPDRQFLLLVGGRPPPESIEL